MIACSGNIITNENCASGFSSTRASLPGQKWCVECNTEKQKEDCTRLHFDLKTKETKPKELTAMCVTCADDQLAGENKQRTVKRGEEVRMEMAEEKTAELEKIQKKPGIASGCCMNCAFNLNHTQTILVSLCGETAAKRIVSRLPEEDLKCLSHLQTKLGC